MRRSLSSSPLVLSAFLSLAACTGAGRGRPPVQSPLPAVISAAEGQAEDVQSDLERGDWGAAQARLDSLRGSRNTVDGALAPPRGTGDSASATLLLYGSALDSLGAAIGRRDSVRGREAANRMSRALIMASGGYVTPVPQAVGLLDVAGRDAGYYAETGRWDDARRMTDELRREYDRVSAHVRTKDAALGDRVSAGIAAVESAVAARNASEVRRTAATVLELVDAIEATFP